MNTKLQRFVYLLMRAGVSPTQIDNMLHQADHHDDLFRAHKPDSDVATFVYGTAAELLLTPADQRTLFNEKKK